MWLIKIAMRRPITLMVIILTIVLSSTLALSRMKVDIFPNLNLPVIYVVQPYGGMDPGQLEAYIVSHYENHFLYITGVDHIESKSIQNVSVMKIVFQPDANMSEAMSQVVAQVERSKSKLPPGTVSPFVLRFDAGNVPIGYLVLTSKEASIAEIEDVADEHIRPILSTIPGATTPHPFGGNVRTMVVTVDPAKLRAYRLSADQVVNAITASNLIAPSGLVCSGNLQRIATINSSINKAEALRKFPIRQGSGPIVRLEDIGTVSDSMDIPTGYALANGRRTVFMAVSKLADASTVDVVNRVKAAVPEMREQIPEAINIDFCFDQSVYVTEAVNGVVYESIVGALLTGLIVLFFLQDFRSSFIVIATIPIALLSAILGLWLTGQTINIMTLSGLSLAVGVLVDEATVAIENIDTHLRQQVHPFKAIFDACSEVVTPQLLAMLSVVFVFLPSFLMVGTTKSLFVPLSLAVGLAMVSSYVLSNTFVPVMAAWMHARKPQAHNRPPTRIDVLLENIRRLHARALSALMPWRTPIVGAYLLLAVVVIACSIPVLKTEIFPIGNPRSFQLRLKAPTGTRIEKTEEITLKALKIIDDEIGQDNVDVTISYVGTNPPNYGVSAVYIWTSGPQEAIIAVSAKPEAHIRTEQLKERLRKRFLKEVPDVTFVFESGDIVSQIMNLGAPTPIQIDVMGSNFERDRDFAEKILQQLAKLPRLRDVAVVQPLEYPTVKIEVDRDRAASMGVSTAEISRAVIPALYSSRFLKQIWFDDGEGHSYQMQVQYPQKEMTSVEDVANVPLISEAGVPPLLRDVANVRLGKMIGEYDRYNLRRMISITANIRGNDLGKAARDVEAAIGKAGAPPRGVRVALRGQVPILKDTMLALATGVAMAILAIVLMLVGYFQRVRLAVAVVSVIPAIFVGVIVSILVSGITVNVQSFMGCIMSVGIGVANSILVVAFSEKRRVAGMTVEQAAQDGCTSRLRPVLMTTIAMIAGMIPMALGLAEGGERAAPLGIAVIGGLSLSTLAVLFVIPLMYCLLQQNASTDTVSVLLEDSIALPVVTHHIHEEEKEPS